MARNSDSPSSFPDQDFANPVKIINFPQLARLACLFDPDHQRSRSNGVVIHPNHQETRSNKRKAEEVSMIQKVENNKKMKMLVVDQMTTNVNVPDDYREIIESEDCQRVPGPDTISVAASNDAPPLGATTDTVTEDNSDSACSFEDKDEERDTVARRAAYNKRSRSSLQRFSDQRRKKENKMKKKMRALQELLPGCNNKVKWKVDKASILDEAIEYVKTLQHQLLLMSIGAHLFTPPMMLPSGMLVPTMNQFSSPLASNGMGIGMGSGFGQAGPVRFTPQVSALHGFPSMPCMPYIPVLGDQGPLLRSWATTSFDHLGCSVPPSSSNKDSSNPKQK